MERAPFHIVAILGFDQPFFVSYTAVLASEHTLSTTSVLEGGIDWGLVLMRTRFGGAIEPILFRFYH